MLRRTLATYFVSAATTWVTLTALIGVALTAVTSVTLTAVTSVTLTAVTSVILTLATSVTATTLVTSVTLTLLTCVTATHAADGATTVDLTPQRAPGQLVRVTKTYEVAGSLTLVDQEKPVKMPMAVSATAVYDERLLGGGPMADIGRNSNHGSPRRSARYYEKLDVKLLINGKEIRPALRNNQRLISAWVSDGRLDIFSPRGPLMREELDLVQWPGDSLIADVFLPDRSVAVGNTWQIDDAWLGALLCLDKVGESNVSAELTESNRDYACIDANGVVHGIVDGTTTTIEVKSRCYFDLRARRVHSLQFVAKETRNAGEVTPGVEAVSKIRLQFSPLSQSANLSDSAVANLDAPPSADAQRLSFRASNGVYRLLHDRDWHVISDGKSAVILRNIDDGDVLGQCNISALPVIDKGKQVTLESFRDDVRSTLGEHFGQFVTAGEYVDDRGRLVYHVGAVGKVTDVPIHWRYYLVGEPDGRRAALVFTLEEPLVERFGQADRRILSGFEFLAAGETSVSQPQAAGQAPEAASEAPDAPPARAPFAPAAGSRDNQAEDPPQHVSRSDQRLRTRQ